MEKPKTNLYMLSGNDEGRWCKAHVIAEDEASAIKKFRSIFSLGEKKSFSLTVETEGMEAIIL